MNTDTRYNCCNYIDEHFNESEKYTGHLDLITVLQRFENVSYNAYSNW